MSSVLQELLLKLKPQLLKREEWSRASNEQQLQLLRIEKVSEAFLSLIILLISSNERLQKLDQFRLVRESDKILTVMAGVKSVPVKTMKRILGLFISKEFEGNHMSLNNLKDQFSLHYEEDEDEEDELLSKVSGDDDNFVNDLDFSDFGFFVGDSTASNLSEKKSSGIKKETEWGDDLHYMRVMEYLKQHSSPPTQLTYLCQQFGWPLSYKQNITNDGQFQVSALVGFNFKKIKKEVTETFIAKQKKIGRIVSSFKMLKKIYLNFPEIWDIYQSKRSKKSMKIENNQFNPLKLMDLTVIEEKVEAIAPIKEDRTEEIKKERDDYLGNIQNYKSEYNILNQNNPGFFPITYEKINVANNKWKVRGAMQIKYKGRQQIKQACETQPNSKLAQQNVTKSLVTWVYQNFHQILQKMSMIKKKKSIRT